MRLLFSELSSLNKIPNNIDEHSNHGADQEDKRYIEDSAIALKASIFPGLTISVVKIVDQIDGSWNCKSEDEKIHEIENSIESAVGSQKDFNAEP